MNPAQEAWWKQARADFELFKHLQGLGAWHYPCHTLLALQMASEKIAKASFRASSESPPKLTHLGLSKLLLRLGTVRGCDQSLVADTFSVTRFDQFERLLRRIGRIAREVEKLAPALAGADRENVEYPWPHSVPLHVPAEWTFGQWERLNTADGRAFLRFLSRAIEGFPRYARVFRG